MLGSILSGSLYKLNPEIVNPWLHPTLAWIGHRLPILLLIFVLLRLATLRWDTNWLLRIAAGLALLVTLTVAAHWIAFRIFGMLMPRGRTALYLIPLATLLAGTIAALPSSSSIATWTRRGLQCTIFALAIYFLLCLRLMYFKEWEWGADVKRVYPVVAYYNHAYCVDEIPVSWLYTGSLNYYRVMSGRESLKPFDETLSWELFPKDKPVYVLHAGLDGPLIEREKLKVVHRSDFTDVVVAVRPEMLTAPPGSCKSTSVPSGDPTTADRP
jgi:hypothetical protein